jgi:KUP system potassium uptake protein
LVLIYPACTFVVLRSGASILADPDTIRAPFFLLVPPWAQPPMVLLATAATVIASQAVINGAFSMARQAAQLGYLPRLRILQTSSQTIGQIYVPYVNWASMIAVVALVLASRRPRPWPTPSAWRSPAPSSSPPCCCST